MFYNLHTRKIIKRLIIYIVALIAIVPSMHAMLADQAEVIKHYKNEYGIQNEKEVLFVNGLLTCFDSLARAREEIKGKYVALVQAEGMCQDPLLYSLLADDYWPSQGNLLDVFGQWMTENEVDLLDQADIKDAIEGVLGKCVSDIYEIQEAITKCFKSIGSGKDFRNEAEYVLAQFKEESFDAYATYVNETVCNGIIPLANDFNMYVGSIFDHSFTEELAEDEAEEPQNSIVINELMGDLKRVYEMQDEKERLFLLATLSCLDIFARELEQIAHTLWQIHHPSSVCAQPLKESNAGKYWLSKKGILSEDLLANIVEWCSKQRLKIYSRDVANATYDFFMRLVPGFENTQKVLVACLNSVQNKALSDFVSHAEALQDINQKQLAIASKEIRMLALKNLSYKKVYDETGSHRNIFLNEKLADSYSNEIVEDKSPDLSITGCMKNGFPQPNNVIDIDRLRENEYRNSLIYLNSEKKIGSYGYDRCFNMMLYYDKGYLASRLRKIKNDQETRCIKSDFFSYYYHSFPLILDFMTQCFGFKFHTDYSITSALVCRVKEKYFVYRVMAARDIIYHVDPIFRRKVLKKLKEYVNQKVYPSDLWRSSCTPPNYKHLDSDLKLNNCSNILEFRLWDICHRDIFVSKSEIILRVRMLYSDEELVIHGYPLLNEKHQSELVNEVYDATMKEEKRIQNKPRKNE